VTADSDASAGNGQTAFTHVYGTALAFAGTEFTTSGLVNGDTVTSAALDSTGKTATAGVSGSPYAVTVGSAADTGLHNYPHSHVPRPLTARPTSVTVTADSDASAGNGQTAFTHVYGTALAFAGTEFTTSGLVNGDTVTSAALDSTGKTATAGVSGSPYAVTIASAAGTGLGNYSTSYVPGTLNVTAK